MHLLAECLPSTTNLFQWMIFLSDGLLTKAGTVPCIVDRPSNTSELIVAKGAALRKQEIGSKKIGLAAYGKHQRLMPSSFFSSCASTLSALALESHELACATPMIDARTTAPITNSQK